MRSWARVFLLCWMVMTPMACSDDPALVPAQSEAPVSIPLQVAGRQVTVELALTPTARNRGLMHRSSLPVDHGMLFIFTDVAPRQFWMRDTLIGLDIVFLDADGTVQNVTEAPPGVERPGFHSLRPAQFVLEMVRGWCREAGLAPGDQIQIPPEVVALAR